MAISTRTAEITNSQLTNCTVARGDYKDSYWHALGPAKSAAWLAVVAPCPAQLSVGFFVTVGLALGQV